MTNRAIVSDKTGKSIIPTGKYGRILGVNIKASGTATAVALYEGQAADADKILSIHAVAANGSTNDVDMEVDFGATGVYALPDANTEMLIVHFEAAGTMPAAVISGS